MIPEVRAGERLILRFGDSNVYVDALVTHDPGCSSFAALAPGLYLLKAIRADGAHEIAINVTEPKQ